MGPAQVFFKKRKKMRERENTQVIVTTESFIYFSSFFFFLFLSPFFFSSYSFLSICLSFFISFFFFFSFFSFLFFLLFVQPGVELEQRCRPAGERDGGRPPPRALRAAPLSAQLAVQSAAMARHAGWLRREPKDNLACKGQSCMFVSCEC
jgi:hypothetical protein